MPGSGIALETTEPGLVPIRLPGSGALSAGILLKIVNAGVALSMLGAPACGKANIAQGDRPWFSGGPTKGIVAHTLA